MSCQQASRYNITTNNSSIINNNIQVNSNCKILNNNNQNHIIIKENRTTRGVIQQEDPYVFTESVPTTPPILFSTQKTRSRLNDLTSATNIGKLQQQKLPLAETNGKITLISNEIKTQASFLSSTATATNTCIAPTSKSNVNHSIAGTTTITNNNHNSKKLTNVCVVRPQLQTQPSHYHQQQNHHQHCINSYNEYDGDLKSISPPPLYTPPTPSLWQTPLLLESTTFASGNSSPKLTNVAVRKTPMAGSQTLPVMGCVTTTVQTVGSTTITLNPSLTTTAMAKVAPIVVHAPLAPPPPPVQSLDQCLPPSKFHNHTMAQHLEKVECLKMAKKLTEAEMSLCHDNGKSSASTFKSYSPLTPLTTTALTENAASPVKHSENEDLNEIPVNVIFRMAVVSQAHDDDKSSNNIQFVKPQTETDLQAQPSQPEPTQIAPNTMPTTTQLKTNLNKKLSTPASKELLELQQVNTSSIPQQQHNVTKTTITTALNSHQAPNENKDNDAKKPINSGISTKLITNNSKITITNLKKKTTAHISSKNRKLNSFPSVNNNFNINCNWHMGCNTTKGAVAIVKMSQHNVNLDTSHLATSTGLPYCLQQYWHNSYNFSKYSAEQLMKSKSAISLSLAREERIALRKQDLRRKAMQLLSIRSLQKLPFQLSRRRLLCVNRLLKKYQQNEGNKITLPAKVKRCCISGCEACTLEMASQCQQHIVYNAAQHVFLPCTAKFADNTQCRVPVFDITHDLPLCMEHARKRDAYNRHLYEQRPRKISTNPILMNESIILLSKVSPTKSNAVGLAAGGVTMNSQSYQSKKQQQQPQHILQQLPPNNSINSKKLENSASQQARKRKITAGLTANPVGRPQKRFKKTVEKSGGQMSRLSSTNLKRKSSTTSLESIASNSQHSTTSSTSQQPHQHLNSGTPTIANAITSSLAPPALAPLSTGLVGHGLPQHLFSFGHDNPQHRQPPQHLHPININEKHSFSVSNNSNAKASTPTELKDLISQFSLISQKHNEAETLTADANLLNTNSNSNFTSSGMGSTTSLPTADEFLTQDMLSICENSSASSADTGLGGLSDPELMLGGPEDDIPLGDTHLLEEQDLENVLNSLPEDAFKELFTTVHQDESDEIERAIELADKHLKTLQQTIGSELGDFLDFSDEMLMDNSDICNESTVNTVLDTSALFVESGNMISNKAPVVSNATQSGGTTIGTDIRGLVQT